MRRLTQALKSRMRIDSGFTVTETEQRKLKREEYNRVRRKTYITRSTQASKSWAGIVLGVRVTETEQRKLK